MKCECGAENGWYPVYPQMIPSDNQMRQWEISYKRMSVAGKVFNGWWVLYTLPRLISEGPPTSPRFRSSSWSISTGQPASFLAPEIPEVDRLTESNFHEPIEKQIFGGSLGV